MKKEYAEYLLEKTKKDYDFIAEEFSRTRWNIWEELEVFRKYVKDNDRVLDIGCGNGRLLELFPDKKIDYIGIDNSEKLIELAKKRYPDKKFLIGNALSLPLPENSFDVVFTIAVLHHIPSDEFRLQSLSEIKRVLKPGGILILTVWKFHQLKESTLLFKYTILKLIGKSKLDWKDIFEPWGKKTERYYHYFSKKELEGLIKKSGFKIRESGIIKNPKRNRQNIYLVGEKIEN